MLFLLQSVIATCIAALGMRSSARATESQPFMPYEEPPAVDPLSLVQTFERQASDRFKELIRSHIGG